ncbi:MAG: glycoside hydrolase family 13 protein [Chloroherpetonaceae bacterium]|nr:glycoside hydrolase family 13 protein [Chloroherpetonaceae bacterium]
MFFLNLIQHHIRGSFKKVPLQLQSHQLRIKSKQSILFSIFLFVYFFSPLPLSSQSLETSESKRNGLSGSIPKWAKSAIWYQIFPERFRNGDPTNDPTLSTLSGAYPHDTLSPWQIHPWGSDWYELQPYEKKNGKNIWFNIQRRRYGGDLQGIIDKLDYLKDLGITAIYLNPIFEAPSSHKYDGMLYHHIDPNFGPSPSRDRELMNSETPDDPTTWVWTEADKLALKLIEEAHQKGIRIIFDGVFNHLGIRSFAFKDVKINRENSRFKDWFIIKNFGDSNGKGFDYTGWFGVKELPELNEIDGDYPESLKQYIYASTERWMSPNGNRANGIDGWRLDVAFCVGHPFWKRWRGFVKSINPEAYLTAEVIDTPEAQKPYLLGDEFDAVMNYNFAFSVFDFFISKPFRISVSEFDKKLKQLRESFPEEVAYGMQNLMDSHDAARLATQIVNRDIGNYRDFGKYFELSKGSNKAFKVRKPNNDEIIIQKLIALFQMTYIGAPMIYYGDEVGMWGANDPCDRKPMIWDDIAYKPEKFNPDGSTRTPDKVKPDNNLLLWYKSLISIRNHSPALQFGSYRTILKDDAKKIFAFERRLSGNSESDDEHFIVAINNGDITEKVIINVDGKWWDMINNIEVELSYQTNVKVGKMNVKQTKKSSIQKRVIQGKTSSGVVIFLPPKTGVILKRV